jgi:hypothetical protein
MLEFIKELFRTEGKRNKRKSVGKGKITESANLQKSADIPSESTYSQRWESSFSSFLEEFCGGKESLLPTIYCYLASSYVKTVVQATHAIAEYMSRQNFKGICHLDNQFRETTSMNWYVDWKNFDIKSIHVEREEDRLQVLRLGTFHPNGYFREKCIRALKGDNASLPYVILRLNDWVKEVRAAAEETCLNVKKLSASEIIIFLPYLEKVRNGVRANSGALAGLEKEFAESLSKNPLIIDKTFIRQNDEKNRESVYRFLANNKLLEKENVNSIMSWEKSGQIQNLLMTILIEKYTPSIPELDEYINNKSVNVQKKALEQKYNLLKDYWDGLENLLLSRSLKVREMTRYILKKHTQIDAKTYYTKRLESEYKNVCIQGIGECGSAKDADIIRPYLEESDSCIVKASIHAIALLLKEDAIEIYKRFLPDSREVVAHQAYKEIAAYNLKCGAENLYNLCLTTQSELMKEKYAYRLLKEPVWEALPYILMLYSCDDETVKSIMRSITGNFRTYATLSSGQAERIKSIMDAPSYEIPEKLKEKILFSMKYAIK